MTNIWKIISIIGMGMSLVLICVAFVQSEEYLMLSTLNTGIGAANFTLLAVIVDKLSNEK